MNARSGNSRWLQEPENDPTFDRYELPLNDDGDDFFDIRKLANTIWRGKWTILLFILLGAGMALMAASRMEPRYTATTNILFEPERMQIMDFAQVLTAPDSRTNLGNQIEILTSNMLLSQVVDVLALDVPPPELAPPMAETVEEPNALSTRLQTAITDLLQRLRNTDEEVSDEPVVIDPEELQAMRTSQAMSWLRDNLSLIQVTGASVIEVGFTSGDPAQSAQIANTISEQYIQVQRDAAREEVQTIVDTLNRRIEELKARLDSAEQAVEAARLELSERQAQSSEMTTIQLNTMNDALADIRLALSEAQARHERAATALSEDRDLWVVTEFRESDLISAFRAREIEVLEAMAQDRAISGDNRTPARAVADARLEEIRRNIREEANYIVQALDFEASSLRQREEQLQEMIRALEVTRIEQTADELQIARLERDALATRNLYESFADRVKEISEQSNLPTLEARVLSFAGVPGSPDRDQGQRLVGFASMASMFLGAFWVLVRERIKNSFHSPNELTETVGLKVIAAIPQVGRSRSSRKLVSHFVDRPNSLLSESIRNLRTSILFADQMKRPKVVMFTSSVPNEAKSATSLLMGVASQQLGKKTILVSCDLRDRSNVRLFADYPKLDEKAPRFGIAALLEGECSLSEALVVEPRSGLHVLALSPKDQITGSPADLLASDQFEDLINQLRGAYQLVLLDTPPALAVTDARLLARVADTVVYLVRWNWTNKNAVKEGLKEMASMNIPIAGCVFTSVKQSKAAKYSDNEFFYKRSYGKYFS